MITLDFRIVGFRIFFRAGDICKLIGLGHVSFLEDFGLSSRIPTAEQCVEIFVSHKVNGRAGIEILELQTGAGDRSVDVGGLISAGAHGYGDFSHIGHKVDIAHLYAEILQAVPSLYLLLIRINVHRHGSNGEVVHSFGVNLVNADFDNLKAADKISVCIVLRQRISCGHCFVVGDSYCFCFLVEDCGIGNHALVDINRSGIVGQAIACST